MAETRRKTIAISFIPLLKQVAAYLGLFEPTYYYADLSKKISYVEVLTERGPPHYIFWGEEGGSLDESCEQAAKKGVLFFVKKHGIRVHDVNLKQKETNEMCAELYKLKKRGLECREKGVPYELPGTAILERANQAVHEVRVDYCDILRKVVTDLNIPEIHFECLQGNNKYIARCIIEYENTPSNPASVVIGEMSSSVFEAKQSLAEKAILHLMSRFGFEVEDVNFHFLGLTSYSMKLQMESCYAVRERVSGVKQGPIFRTELVVEDDYDINGAPLPATKCTSSAELTQSLQPDVPTISIAGVSDTIH